MVNIMFNIGDKVIIDDKEYAVFQVCENDFRLLDLEEFNRWSDVNLYNVTYEEWEQETLTEFPDCNLEYVPTNNQTVNVFQQGDIICIQGYNYVVVRMDKEDLRLISTTDFNRWDEKNLYLMTYEEWEKETLGNFPDCYLEYIRKENK